jgi:hypothetical protein
MEGKIYNMKVRDFFIRLRRMPCPEGWGRRRP